jgi:hypothetical protein
VRGAAHVGGLVGIVGLGWVVWQVASTFDPSSLIGAGIVVVLVLLLMRNQREDTKEFLKRLGEVDVKVAGIPGTIQKAVEETRHTLRAEYQSKMAGYYENTGDEMEKLKLRIAELELLARRRR